MTDKTQKYFWLAGCQDGDEIIESCESPKMLSEGGKFNSLSPRRSSLDELKIKSEILTNPCKECKGVVSAHYVAETSVKIIERNVCFTCLFWLKIIEEPKSERRVIADGTAYWRKDYVDKSKHNGFLGFSGSIFNIEMSNGEKHKTNNMWCQGEIPERFKNRLPDNAKFLTNG